VGCDFLYCSILRLTPNLVLNLSLPLVTMAFMRFVRCSLAADRFFKPIFLVLAIGFLILLALTRLNLQAQTNSPNMLILPTVISDHMVLQQQTNVAIWGWDKPGTAIAVNFRNNQRSTQAGLDGQWFVRIPSGTAGRAFSLTIRGSQTITLSDVLVGEVWIAGGQSNMWWSVQNSLDAEQTIATANTASIRVWDANTAPKGIGWKAPTRQKTVPAEWKPTTPRTVGAFPATAYFFAQKLQQNLDVPIGIVHLAVPGREIEAFLSPELMTTHWPQTIELQQIPASQSAATPNRASELFNGMVYPTAPYTARGFIWWQGESNAERSHQYRVLFPSLIQEWRQLWQQENAPFLYVELANFLSPQRHPVEDDAWPALRDAQRTALRLPQTAMISAIDVLGAEEDVNDGHPRNKRLVGERLGLAALNRVYGKTNLAWSGPTFQSVEFRENQAIVTFDQVGEGLKTKDGSALRGFALAGANQRFFWAKAMIQDNTIVLTSSAVEQPVAVRYNWANNPIGNLYNSADLPTAPFRSDTWELGIKTRQLQEMDWTTLASYIDRSLSFQTIEQQETWNQAYRLLGNDSHHQASSLIEQLSQQAIEEATLAKAIQILLFKLSQ